MAADNDVNEVNENQDLLAELDEMDTYLAKPIEDKELDDVEDQGTPDEETNENVNEAEEDAEDSDSEEDQDEEDEESSDDEGGEEEQDQEDEDEAEADDQDQASDADSLRAEINNLNQIILDLQSGKQKPVEEKPAEETKPKEAPTIPITDLKFDEDFDFFQGQDSEDVFDDPKKFGKCLVDFANQVSQKTVVQTMLAVPEVIRHQTKEELSIQKTVDKFYSDNEDLKPLKATVAQVCNKVASEHPDYTLEEIFKESADRTRKVLNLVKKHKKEKKNQKASNLETNPNKANIGKPKGKKKKKQKKSNLTPLQRELDEMN